MGTLYSFGHALVCATPVVKSAAFETGCGWWATVPAFFTVMLACWFFSAAVIGWQVSIGKLSHSLDPYIAFMATFIGSFVWFVTIPLLAGAIPFGVAWGLGQAKKRRQEAKWAREADALSAALLVRNT